MHVHVLELKVYLFKENALKLSRKLVITRGKRRVMVETQMMIEPLVFPA